MQISKEVCGFTGGQADTLRKAVGKKNIELMKKMKGEFIEGAVKHSNANREKVEKFWDHLEEFANYCFNKSHAACYALIAYWTAYIKAHFPDAFMAALMTADSDDTDRLAIEIAECRKMGIQVLGPDVNESYRNFAIVPHENKIRFGLLAVKAVGGGAVDAVLDARKADGKFKSVLDFAKRVNARAFNKRAWDSLIMTGAFDEFGTRSDLMFNLEKIQAYGSKIQKEALSGQADLFSMLGDSGESLANLEPEIELTPAPKQNTEKEMLTWERDLLGLYVSAHPLDKYVTYFEEQTVPLSQIQPNTDGQRATIGGIVLDLRTIITKAGTKMAFVKMEDKTGEGEIIVFPNLYAEMDGKIQIDAVLKIEGKVSARDRDGNLKSDAQLIAETISVITDEELENYESTGRRADGLKAKKQVAQKPQKTVSQSVSASKTKKWTNEPSKTNSKPASSTPKAPADKSRSAENYQAEKIQKVFVHIKNPNDHENLLAVKKLCGKYSGMSEMILVLGTDNKSAIRMPFRVDSNSSLPKELVNLLGEDCVVIK